MAVEGVIGEAWILIKPSTTEFAPQLKKDVTKAVTAADAEASASLSKTQASAGTAVSAVSGKTTKAYGEVAAAEANLAATTATYGEKSAEASVAASRLSGAHKKLDASMESNESHIDRLNGKVNKLGGGMLSSGTGALIGAVGIGEFAKHTAEAAVSYESEMAAIQNATGETDAQIKDLGSSFLANAKSGNTTFTAGASATAYSAVAGQLKLAHGQALDTTQALKFMTAAENDAEASGQDLGSTTAALAATMQTFHVPLKDVADESDVLYNVSKSLNVPIANISAAVDKMHAKLGVAAPSLGDVSALMIQASRAGITGSRGILTISSAMQTLLSGATKAGKGVKGTKEQIESARISAQSAADAVTKAAAGQGGTGSEAYAIAVEKSNLAQEKYNATLHGTPAKLTAAQQTIKSLGLEVYNSSGKFVGMSSLIDQLKPKLDKMSQSQQNLALKTLFGSSSAQLMLNIIHQGSAGWDQATSAANKHGTAQAGADKQAKTLTGDMKKLDSEFNAIETDLGGKLVPVLETTAGWLTKHTVIAEGLAAVVGTVLLGAVARYSFGVLKDMGSAGGAILKHAGEWVGLGKTANAEGDKIIKKNVEIGASEDEVAGQMALDTTAEDAELVGVGAAAGTEAAEIGAADVAIEGSEAAAAVSLGAVATAAGVAAAAVGAGLLINQGITDKSVNQKAESDAAGGQVGGLLKDANKLGLDKNPQFVAEWDKLKPAYEKAETVRTLPYVGAQASEKMLDPIIASLTKTLHKYAYGGPDGEPLGWHAPMAKATPQNRAALEKMIAQQTQHAKTAETYANTGNGFLSQITALAKSIDTNTAKAAAKGGHQKRFANAESR